MSDDTPLQRAHALSAHASNLLQSTSCDEKVLQTALKAYIDAANLFEQSASEVAEEDSNRRTLQLLTTQNRKLARDVERRLNAFKNEKAAGTSAQTRQEATRRNTSPLPDRGGPGLGLGAIARQAWPPPGIATRLSPSRGVPPFALRPPPTEEGGSSVRPLPSRASTSTTSQSLDPILSPLHSSSSSSGTEIGESYINFGVPPETLDPFSRFWGMLDNMLDDISNPVAFATAPTGTVTRSAQEALDTARRKGRPKGSERQKDKGKGKGDADSESFYLVNKGAISTSQQDTETPRNRSPIGKTPEELALENESLRASLDALAVHTHAVETENKALRSEGEERTRAMKTVINEVRREAQKAKHSQDLIRSQMMASIPSPAPRASGRLEASRLPGDSDLVQSQKKRIEELERQVQSLKAECDKQRDHATRYKERIDKIKANAKSKKEAKAKAEEGVGER